MRGRPPSEAERRDLRLRMRLCCAVLHQACCWAALAYITFLALAPHIDWIWIAYVVPAQPVWDGLVHWGRDDANTSDGSVWHTHTAIHIHTHS